MHGPTNFAVFGAKPAEVRAAVYLLNKCSETFSELITQNHWTNSGNNMEFDLRLMRLGYFQPWGFNLRGGLSEPLTVERGSTSLDQPVHQVAWAMKSQPGVTAPAMAIGRVPPVDQFWCRGLVATVDFVQNPGYCF
ncbi:hypothetical protein P879_04756 [Paragonimus westermani]|uniref:Uncharacterized protein n=1 Tax=Paragonimus westermani TaxID=34504 RepID=A0A8T0DJV2_9TREM|nr:hypothetical protein P879_04756 [Paragonimus westermani]